MQEGTAGWSSQESKQISSGKGYNCALILENKELPEGKASFSKHCPIVNANLLFQRGLEGKKSIPEKRRCLSLPSTDSMGWMQQLTTILCLFLHLASRSDSQV